MQVNERLEARGQHRPDGYAEPPLLTFGQDFGFLPELPQREYTAADVVRYLLGTGSGQ